MINLADKETQTIGVARQRIVHTPRLFVALLFLSVATSVVSCKNADGGGSAFKAKTDSPQIDRMDQRLNDSFEQFDQSDDSGWRVHIKKGEYVAACNLMRAYLECRKDLKADQRALLSFHLGQMLGVLEENNLALLEMKKSEFFGTSELLPVSWNRYVQATMMFLARDKTGAEMVRAEVAASPHKEYLGAIEWLLRNWEKPYKEIILN